MTLKERIESIHNFFIRLFASLKKYEAFVANTMRDIIPVITTILIGIQSPELATLEMFLPADWKNWEAEKKAKALDLLTKGVQKLNLSADCLTKPTQLEILICFLTVFGKKSEVEKQALAAKLAALMLQAASKEDDTIPTLKDSQADYMSAEYFFSKKINLITE